MYFRNLSRSSVSWSDVGKENSVPNQLLYTKQTSIRRTQGSDWTSAGVMFTTHTHTHTHLGKQSTVTLKQVTLNYLNDQDRKRKRGIER